MPIYNTNTFIKRARLKHGFKFSYERTNYINNRTKIIITCFIHGDFKQIPYSHISGDGCAKCYFESKCSSQNYFIQRAILKHGNRFTYENTKFINMISKVNITCKIHGDFSQRPVMHLKGQGCKKCVADSLRSNTTIFINKAKKIHKNFFNYEKVKYVNNYTNVTITCNIHGDFEQLPHNHLQGKGCHLCKLSKGEQEILKILQDSPFEIKTQVKISLCKNKQVLPFDIGIYSEHQLKGLIEFHGFQHYNSVKYFGGEKAFKQRQKRDNIKEKFCIQNKIPLLVIPYTKIKEMDIEIMNFIITLGQIQ